LLLDSRFRPDQFVKPARGIENVKERLLLRAEDLAASGGGHTLRCHDLGMILAWHRGGVCDGGHSADVMKGVDGVGPPYQVGDPKAVANWGTDQPLSGPTTWLDCNAGLAPQPTIAGSRLSCRLRSTASRSADVAGGGEGTESFRGAPTRGLEISFCPVWLTVQVA